MLSYIVQGLGYGFTAAVQPGPFQTFVLAQALNRGWRRALPMALAPLLSDGPIITLMLLVLTHNIAVLLRVNELFYRASLTPFLILFLFQSQRHSQVNEAFHVLDNTAGRSRTHLWI